MLMTCQKISGEVCPESDFSALESSENVALCTLTRRRWLTGLLATSTSCALWDLTNPSIAMAGAAVPISLTALVERSRHIVVGTPRVADSTWEEIGGSQRLVTYTRLTIEDTVDDRAFDEAEILVRTLGGRLGPIGQVVHGEAELRREETAVFFVTPRRDGGTYHITGFSQGHYPLLANNHAVRRLTQSPHLPTFVTKRDDAAVTQLSGQSLLAARSLVTGVLSAR